MDADEMLAPPQNYDEPPEPAPEPKAPEPEPEPETPEEGDEPDPEAEDREASEAGKKLAKRSSPQARINKAVAAQRAAERERDAYKAELEEAKRRPSTPPRDAEEEEPPRTDPEPEPDYMRYVKGFGKTPEDFPDYDAYNAALNVHIQRALLSERDEADAASRRQADADRAAQELVAQHATRVDEFKKAHADYDDVLSNPDVPATAAMVKAIFDSEAGPAIAYHLATNIDEAARIANLPLDKQLVEMGKLDAAFTTRSTAAPSSPASATPKSNAPKPMPRVGGGAVATAKSLEQLADEGDVETWLDKRNAEVAKARRAG